MAASGESEEGGVWRRFGRAAGAVLEALSPRKALARAEADARLAEERLRAALDALPEGIVFLDAEGRYVMWNRTYAEIYRTSADLFAPGARLEDTLRIGVARGDYPEAIGREEEWLAHRLDLMANPGQRHEQRLADGRWILIEERRTRDGGLIGLRIDITAMKEQAAALREALSRAEAANRAKAEFLAAVSHELLTPLNGVMGLSEVLAGTRLNVRQSALVDDVRASAVQLGGRLRDLLDFADLDAGRLRLEPQRFELAEVAAAVVRAAEPAARAKGLDVALKVSDGVEGSLTGDPQRVRQLLDHLVSNAVKFTEAGGVTVRVSSVYGGERYRIVVADTGPGFDETETERLFGRFETGDASLSRRAGGVGLGLAICRHLAELMGGEITARSRPGEGAVFTVTLPLPREEPERDVEGLRVLLADDNPTNRKVVELMLQALDAQVVSVADGRAAADAAAKGGFDLVLMDLQMPVMDGLSAIRAIRADEAAAGKTRLPIVVLSANAAEEDVAASAAAGADGHLGKPISAGALVAALGQVADR